MWEKLPIEAGTAANPETGSFAQRSKARIAARPLVMGPGSLLNTLGSTGKRGLMAFRSYALASIKSLGRHHESAIIFSEGRLRLHIGWYL